MLEIGMTNSVESKVTHSNTAKSIGSGSLDVFATPAMIALIEKAAAELIQKNLDDGKTSVGISVNIDHKSPTPIGLTVRAEVEIVEIDGKKIKFNARVFDSVSEIGSGSHTRFIVDSKKFQMKADSKTITQV